MQETELEIEWDGRTGSDGHITTQLILEMMREAVGHIQPHTALDLGCGSGVLGLSAARLFGCRVIGVDIAETAVALTERNIVRNGMEAQMMVLRADGCKDGRIQRAAPFDLILCNILATVILGIAQDMVKVLAREGYLMLSGIQPWQVDEVRDHFMQLGMIVTAEFQHDEWACLLLYKPMEAGHG